MDALPGTNVASVFGIDVCEAGSGLDADAMPAARKAVETYRVYSVLDMATSVQRATPRDPTPPPTGERDVPCGGAADAAAPPSSAGREASAAAVAASRAQRNCARCSRRA